MTLIQKIIASYTNSFTKQRVTDREICRRSDTICMMNLQFVEEKSTSIFSSEFFFNVHESFQVSYVFRRILQERTCVEVNTM